MKTVLLIGAGATRATRPKIALSKRAPLDSDFFHIARAVNRSRYRRVLGCLNELVGDFSSSLASSLERATTYLYLKAVDTPNGSAYHIGFLELLSLLNEVLAKTTNPIPVGPRSLMYRLLLSELRQLEAPEDLSIITFNYDLLLERALQSTSKSGHHGTFTFPGCYRLDGVTWTPPIRSAPKFDTEGHDHSGAALLKLHGSLNWQSSHTSNTPTPSALLRADRELHVMNSTRIPQSLSWRKNQKMVHMKPIIVPPVSGKRGMMQRDVLSLWPKAGEALQSADRVIIAGYSCPPLDLESRILLSENLRANKRKRVYVIDPNPEVASGFVELCGVDHITVYTSISSWIRDARH